MLESTPLNCPRKPGEPGGEKARAAKDLFDSLSDHAPIPTVLLNQEQFTRAVAGALAACALEARKEVSGECADILLACCSNVIENKQHPSNGVREAYEAIRALERAVEGKA